MQCDILSKDYASHMNVRANLLKDRTTKNKMQGNWYVYNCWGAPLHFHLNEMFSWLGNFSEAVCKTSSVYISVSENLVISFIF